MSPADLVPKPISMRPEPHIPLFLAEMFMKRGPLSKKNEVLAVPGHSWALFWVQSFHRSVWHSSISGSMMNTIILFTVMRRRRAMMTIGDVTAVLLSCPTSLFTPCLTHQGISEVSYDVVA